MTDTVNVPREVLERLVAWINREVPIPTRSATRWAMDITDLLAAAPKAEPVSDPYKLEPLLWSMHVLGPDDVYPAPDLETAFKWCEYVNTQLAPLTPDVLCAAIPALWDGTPEQHAKSLPEAIKGWAVPAPASDELLEAAERALKYIDACAEAGEFTPNDDAENPCDIWNALSEAIAKHNGPQS